MIKLNLNEQCRVKLTEHGKSKWMTHLVEFMTHHEANEYIITKSDVFGYHKFVLWELMQIFGSEHWNGAINMMFEDNDICFN